MGNKVVRRILISFVLATLVPTAILGSLSYQQASKQLHNQSSQFLRKSSKDYVLKLIDQLKLLESTLRLASTNAEPSNQSFRSVTLDPDLRIEKKFINIIAITPQRENIKTPKEFEFIPQLTKQDHLALDTGKSLVKFISTPKPKNSQLWMAINLVKNRPEAGILLAEINPDTFWEPDFIKPNMVWILDDANHLLFASSPDIDLPPEVRTGLTNRNSGDFNWQNKDAEYIGYFWQISIKSVFATPKFIVVQAQSKDLTFAAIQQFSKIYPPVIILAFLIVAFFSTRLITKYLTPLERLKAATLRIANGDLNTHVVIESKDEFESLANSFNEMTRRLRSQFDMLSTMAEIDRNILSALNAEDIIDITLDRLPNILFCDLISIARIDPETYFISNIHTRRISHEIEVVEGPIKLTLQDVLELLAMQDTVIETNTTGKLSSYLHIFGNLGDWQYLIIPVVVNSSLSSIICLGYQAPNQAATESLNAARNFGDRIAVALSNAAWEEKLYQQAHYDSLTKLPNRLALNDRLTQEIARAKRDDSQLAVFFIDLDRFKTVNDSLGHSAGDELLSKVSIILVNCVRATDLVVRIGGDEFVIVITDLDSNDNPTAIVSNAAENILVALKQTLVVAQHPMTFTASLGIALFPKDADNPQDLLKNADSAMYHAKNEGRANFRFYSPELNAAALENIKLEQELRGAIAKGELRAYYQPKVDLNRRIVGAEALIRWQHSELGMVSPAKFIPLAEQTGLVVEIGYWILEQTCLWIKACQAQGVEPVRISVNLSGIEFKRPELVEMVASILTKTGVDPKFIELELTESVTVGNIKSCIERMNELKNLGLTLSMDDFGTGFSSLSYLRNLPLDVLKVDQAFVRQLDSDQSSQAIVKAILALANGLDMKTVIEGVETEEQLTFLKQQRCDVFQGFLFSRPVPSDDFLKMLTAESHNKAEV